MDEPPSSPPSQDSSPEESLRWYKKQYEHLEHELLEFQQSSQELEAELEKDVEAAEKRERMLKEKAESLSFEVEEWKTKYKQSKTEANAAQNTLQKEITTLRDTNRSLQLKLRDIEVQNDDFERQARNTTSSLEDLESKMNSAIERGVMLDEEIKIGEQERENLRIETQRLRDELSDLRIEAEIMQEKLKKQSTRLAPISTNITAPNSPAMFQSPSSTASSPMITTPPDSKSVSTADTLSETPTPPSPPVSDSSRTARKPSVKTHMLPPSKVRKHSLSASITTPPKPRQPSTSRPLPRTRAPTTSTTRATPSVIRNAAAKAPATRGLPSSTSLTHIRSLTAQMQRLEQRVQSARSKLPAPVNTPPRASPRNDGTSTSGSGGRIPASVTIRSRKRTGGSTISGTSTSEETPLPQQRRVSRVSTSGISRLSFGPVSHRSETSDGTSRPSSRTSLSNSTFTRPERPSSRAEQARPLSRAEQTPRPASRTSMSGRGTPLSHHYSQTMAAERRPRSSIGGLYHGHSSSVSGIDLDELREVEDFHTPSRRSISRSEMLDGCTGIPTPTGLRRVSGGLGAVPGARPESAAGLYGRRTSSGMGDMRPPTRTRKLSEVGESY